MDYSSAYSLSRDLLKRIAPACLRIETVGSVKRGDPKACANGVHDIEFLIIPDPARIPPVFGAGTNQPKNKLERLIADLKADGIISDPQYVRKAEGERYKKYAIVGHEYTDSETKLPKDFCVEFWIVTACTWAVQNVIRTGPSAFSQRFVTPDNQMCFHKPSGKTYKGLLPAYYEYVRNEDRDADSTQIRVRSTKEPIKLNEEKDAIRLLGLRPESDYWIPADERYMYI